jgi:PAS domain S-box-containing protein
MNKNIEAIEKLTENLTRIESNLTAEKENLEMILENTTDGYWDWNVQTNYEYMSPKFKKQLGYDVHEMEHKPESWQSICNKEDLDACTIEVQKHLKGETPEFKHLLRFTHKKGHQVTILCRGKVVERSNDGTPIRMIGTHTIIDTKGK